MQRGARPPYGAWLVAGVLLLIVLAESAAFWQAMQQGAGGRVALPLDDAYIHQQYARQLARGYLMRYNDQDAPSSGATSLLYPALLALAWAAGWRGEALSAFAFVLGAACLWFSALAAARLGAHLGRREGQEVQQARPWAGLLAALLVLGNGALVWGCLSGMETGLFLALALGTFTAWAEERRGLTALGGILLALTRPEGALLVGVLAAVSLGQAGWNRGAARRPWSWALVLPLGAALAQPLLNLALTGSLSANGMRVKAWLYDVPFSLAGVAGQVGRTLGEIWATFALGVPVWQIAHWPELFRYPAAEIELYLLPPLGPLALGMLLWRAVGEVRGRRVGLATALSLVLIGGLMLGAVLMTAQWHFQRYLLSYYALALVVLGKDDRGRIKDEAGKASFILHPSSFILLMAVVLAAQSLPAFWWRYRETVSTTAQQQLCLGEWARDNLPATARLAVHDAGAIRYVGERAVYDLVGLASPAEASAAFRQGAGSMFEAMERLAVRPTHFALPEVEPLNYLVRAGVAARALLRVEDANRAHIAAAANSQTLYVADWRLAGSGDLPVQEEVRARVRGLTLVDTLDVADLADERDHAYRWWQNGADAGYATELHRLTYPDPPHPQVLDGGRRLTGGESFTLRTTPGQELLLVGRFWGQSAAVLSVNVDGAPAGVWHIPAFSPGWQERTLALPAPRITSALTPVEIRVEAGQPSFLAHRPYHYWAYQGDGVGQVSGATGAQWGEDVLLRGYDLAWRKGALEVTLYWQARRAVTREGVVFVHAVDEVGAMLAQHDGPPDEGRQPLRGWWPGVVVVDTHRLALAEKPQRPVTVWVGLYDPQTMERWPVTGGDVAQRLFLATMSPSPELE